MSQKSYEQSQIDLYTKITFQMYFYESTIIVTTGTCLNLITILIYSGKRFKRSHFGFISAILTLFETISLLISCVIYKFLPTINQDPGTKAEWICFVFKFFGRTFQQMPAFIQLFISVYQYFQMSLGNGTTANMFKTKKSIVLAVGLIVGLVSLVNMPNLYKVTTYTNFIDPLTNASYLKVTCSHPNELALISSVETGLMRVVIPVPLLLSMNYLIARKLYQSRQKFASSSTKTSSSRSQNKERNFTLSLFLSNFLYLLFNLPVSVTYLTVMAYGSDKSSFGRKRMDFIHEITEVFAFIYNALPFFISMALNKVFRNEIVRFLAKITGRNSWVDSGLTSIVK